MKIKLPNYIKKAIELIKNNGGEVYLVGGCVRDSIMQKDLHDYDLTTNILPNKIQDIFKDYKQINNNGIKHGTISVMIDSNIVEITTFRKDQDCDGRHANVTFCNNLKEDLQRRDFTMNALAYTDELGVIDFFNGINDIENKLIKAVGKPTIRFEEDYLRILRALRFASRLGFEIESETKKAIFELKDKLTLISKERLTSELEGILVGEYASEVLMDYKEVFAEIISELTKTFNFNQYSKYHKHDVFKHCCEVVRRVDNKIELRLAALLHDIGKPDTAEFSKKDDILTGRFIGHEMKSFEIAKDILNRFTFTKKVKYETLLLIKHHGANLTTKKAIKRLLFKFNGDFDLLRKLLVLKNADSLDHLIKSEFNYNEVLNLVNELEEESICISIKDIALNGRDLMELGFSGMIIGEILNDLLKKIINEELINDHDILVKYINKKYKK